MLKIFYAVLSLCLFCSNADATDYKVTGKASFLMSATPGFLKINGTGGKIEGTATEAAGIVSGKLIAKVSDFSTGLDLRDDHMRNKYMEMAKFPEIALQFSNYKLGDTEFKADLTFHGVTKPVTGKISGKDKKLAGKFEINILDFGVAKPNWKGVGADEKLQAEFEIEYN